jgi:hypothetical protein
VSDVPKFASTISFALYSVFTASKKRFNFSKIEAFIFNEVM